MADQSKASFEQQSKLVAVVVPLSNRTEFTPEEHVSFRHLTHFLGKYDKYFVLPKSLEFDHPGFGHKRFDDRFFGSLSAHNKLLFSPRFYRAFRDYKYILMYHLDALVFSDQLMQWCETDLDYIGAPWINCDDSAWVRVPRVGNMGFSLIKIESFLKVFHSNVSWVEPDEYWKSFCAKNPKYVQYLHSPKKYLKRLRVFNGARWAMSKWTRGADLFWSDEATTFHPEFKVAPFQMGLRFAFEVAPRLCFEQNNYTLPFGCHAWSRYDREFWEPYLLR